MSKRKDDLWLKHFEEYKNFVIEEGRFPSAHVGAVGQWLYNQVTAYKGGFLPKDRLDLLNAFNPVWCGDREAKLEENKRLLVKSNWKAKIPEGHITIDSVLDGSDLYQCLSRGIYSCEMYFEQKPLSFDFSKAEIKAFNALFPNLDYGCTNLLTARYGSFLLADNLFPKWLSGVHFPEYSDFPNPYKSKEDMRAKIDATLNTMAEREKMVLVLRYGLQGYDGVADGLPKTCVEIGAILNVTAERVRQIEAKALRKLRHPHREKFLFFSDAEFAEKSQLNNAPAMARSSEPCRKCLDDLIKAAKGEAPDVPPSSDKPDLFL